MSRRVYGVELVRGVDTPGFGRESCERVWVGDELKLAAAIDLAEKTMDEEGQSNDAWLVLVRNSVGDNVMEWERDGYEWRRL